VALALAAVLSSNLLLRANAVATWDDAPAGLWMVLSPIERRWTMLGVAAEWARLLLWPARLAIEYSPPEIAVHRAWSLELLPSATVVVGATALAIASWRRVPVATFGLGLAAVALMPVANLLVPTGVVLAERTLLLPSVGVLLALGAWGAAIWHDAGRPRLMMLGVTTVTAVLTTFGVVRSATRTTIWRDDATLLAAATSETPRSYRPWYLEGQRRVRTGQVAQAEAPLLRAVSLFPDDYGALSLLGDVYRRQDRCGRAVPLLERALLVYPDGADARANLAACLIGMGRFADARQQASEGERRGIEPQAFRALNRLADSLGLLARPAPKPLP
jgi:hypothetical protein